MFAQHSHFIYNCTIFVFLVLDRFYFCTHYLRFYFGSVGIFARHVDDCSFLRCDTDKLVKMVLNVSNLELTHRLNNFLFGSVGSFARHSHLMLFIVCDWF